MPELNWIGKPAVRAHHREVDFHLLKDVPELACHGEADSGNLIVQGDNLRALKALLPRYAGQVKCIYIDPPYNTGNEGWVYNDNVKAPEIQKWLGDTVGKEAEDLSRHDKWLCMMYPRLQLLKRFLREDGSIWVSIDDNEAASLRMLMDEVFGRQCFIAQVCWESRYSRSNDASISVSHNFNFVYSPNPELWKKLRHRLPRNDEQAAQYKNPDNDLKGPWRAIPWDAPNLRPNLTYPITTPTGKIRMPPAGRCWSRTQDQWEAIVASGLAYFGKSGDGAPSFKQYLHDAPGIVPNTWWSHEDAGHTDEAQKELQTLFPGESVFATPKPTRLIQRILQIATDKDSLVLDSFGGSGTTGHAVLKQNAEDGGTRRFILVEMEEKIARTITAERVRRVVERSKVVRTAPCAAEESPEVLANPESAKAEEDLFSQASAAAEVRSKNRTEDCADHLEVPAMPGFRFAVLGDTLFDAEGNIRETVTFADLAEFVWFQQTGAPLPPPAQGKRTPLLGIHRGTAVYLLFNGILGDKAVNGGNVLTRPLLQQLSAYVGEKVIYGAACRMSDLHLRQAGVTFKQLPYHLEVNAWL